MEIFDVVDEHDNVVGQASRSACHADPTLVHRTVHFTLIDSARRQIMITRRSRTQRHDGGKLCFLGEHVVAGEDYEQAVRRGVNEELGITVSTAREVGEHVFSGETFTERVKLFVGEHERDGRLRLDPKEIESVEWLPVGQLGSLATSAMTAYWIYHVDWAGIFD